MQRRCKAPEAGATGEDKQRQQRVSVDAEERRDQHDEEYLEAEVDLFARESEACSLDRSARARVSSRIRRALTPSA